MDTTRWTTSKKEAVVEGFEQARDELAGELEKKLESSCGQQAGQLARSWFESQIQSLRLVAAGGREDTG